jgi:hypothetical protein
VASALTVLGTAGAEVRAGVESGGVELDLGRGRLIDEIRE